MKPGTLNLTDDLLIYQGDDYSLPLRLKDGSDVYINLTGYTPKAQIRAQASSPQFMAEFTCTLGNQGTTPGLVTLSLTAAQTRDMTSTTNAVWDFQMVGTDGKTNTYAGLLASILIPLLSLLWTVYRDTRRLKADQRETHRMLTVLMNGHVDRGDE